MGGNGTKGYVILITICVPPLPPTTHIHSSLYRKTIRIILMSSSLQSMNLIINYPKIYILIYSPAFIPRSPSTFNFFIALSFIWQSVNLFISVIIILLSILRIHLQFILYHVFHFFVACFVVINQSINSTY